MSKIKVGDKVRLSTTKYPGKLRDEYGTFTVSAKLRIHESLTIVQVTRDNGGTVFSFDDSQIELVRPKVKVFLNGTGRSYA